MINVINLKCSNCNANLEITAEMSTFACAYCGARQIVERRGGTVSLRAIADAISKVQSGTDRTAAELAIKRLKDELRDMEVSYDQLGIQKIRENTEKSNLFGGFLVGAIVLCIIIGWQGGAIGYFAFILWLIATITILIIYSKIKSEIDAKYDIAQAELAQYGNVIQRRISENKKMRVSDFLCN